MVYLNEMKQHKAKPFPMHRLQTFSDKRKVKLVQILLPYFKEYCDDSSIHCMHYLTNTKMQKFEKAIWLIIIAATTFGASYVYIQLSELYYSQRIQTTVADSVHPVFFVPFPSIGICLKSRINWEKLQSAHKQFLHANASDEAIEIFQRFFQRLENLRFGKFAELEGLFINTTTATQVAAVDAAAATAPLRLSLIDEVNVMEVMNYLAFDCDEAFEEACYWRMKSYNCCDLFTLERTEFGHCLVFNSVISPPMQRKAKYDKYYPYHNAKFGEGSGLEVDIVLNKSKIRPGFGRNGVYVMIKQPAQWHSDTRFINHNTFTKIAITPQLTDTDKRCRAVSPEDRRCFFEDEYKHPMYKKIPGLLYWRGNCVTRCRQEYIIKYCNCSLSLFFPKSSSDNFTDCKPSDFKCIYEHERIFSTEHHESESEYVDDVGEDSMICNCLNSCNQFVFVNYYTSVPLDDVSANDSIMKIHIDAYFQSQFILKYETRMRFTFVELLANFGGIIGLFLGASLLSAVELGYFLTIGLYSHLRRKDALHFCEGRKFNIIKVGDRKSFEQNHNKRTEAKNQKEKY